MHVQMECVFVQLSCAYHWLKNKEVSIRMCNFSIMFFMFKHFKLIKFQRKQLNFKILYNWIYLSQFMRSMLLSQNQC